MIVRDPTPADEAAWRQLWAGYLAFYETVLPRAVTDRTWQRILDPASSLFARVAEDNGEVIGFCVNVLHEGTWTPDPICYLEDLFVTAERRGAGVGRMLIEDLIARARERGWSRLYWHTQSSNPARRLYDRFVAADDFVRYRIVLSGEATID